MSISRKTGQHPSPHSAVLANQVLAQVRTQSKPYLHWHRIWDSAVGEVAWSHMMRHVICEGLSLHGTNVLDNLPKSLQPKAKAKLHEIWMSETRKEAERTFDLFAFSYEAKYPTATACLVQDREVLLAFYDFPAEYWRHLRTTKPIESTFATVRLRTAKTKGAGPRLACLTMVFQLALSEQKRWCKLNGYKLLAEVIASVQFTDGIGAIAA